MSKPNKGRQDRIDGIDIVEWMRRSGLVESSMAPAPQRMRHLAAWYEKKDTAEEEHF